MKGTAVAALTAVISLVAAASALAAPPLPQSLRHVEVPASVYLSAHTGAGEYELRLTAYETDVGAQNGEPAKSSSYVSLQLAKPGAAAEYSTRERRFDGNSRVTADWRARGRVDARFVPRRVHHRPVPRCDGDYAIESGLLVGMLSFHGEGRYAAVRSGAMPATLTRQPEMTCDLRSPIGADESHESSRVGGNFDRRGRSLGVTAFEHPALGTLTVYAYSSARRNGFSVNRWVSAVAPLTELALDPEAETATLTAPSPFTGSATYRAFPGKEAGSWHGDLAVDFPGEPGVRLAGKRFQGAKLEPGECVPDDDQTFCSSAKLATPIAIKPALPLAARGGLFLMSE